MIGSDSTFLAALWRRGKWSLTLRRLELRVFERQPFDARIAEIHLHARVVAAAFGVDDDAQAKLRMLDALSHAPRWTGLRRARIHDGGGVAPLRAVDVETAAARRRYTFQ